MFVSLLPTGFSKAQDNMIFIIEGVCGIRP